jgi:DNA-binding CsgD family transcriptional regulator
MHQFGLSGREEQVARQLMEGKSNKQIALALNITERTVEFHLKNIYGKLGVESRVEAILKLRETANILGEPTVEPTEKIDIIDIDDRQPETWNKDNPKVTMRMSLAEIIRFLVTYKFPILFWILLIIIILSIILILTRKPWSYERECEYPNDYTVGKVIQRSNASKEMVHGQFGTVAAWPPQPGYVKYEDINTPGTDHLYLRLRYSKYSSSSVKIQVYLDNESSPRVSIPPIDQGDWDRFVWTDAIDLGQVKKGTHTLKFFTEGQEYGVADLDEFILTAEKP